MTLKQIDYLNIGLMLLALMVAFSLPFELFLFSYAVLGPLHYLTEISWLEKKQYFTNGKRDYLILVVLCLSWVALYLLVKYGFEPGSKLQVAGSKWTNHLIFIAFVAALSMVIFKKLWQKLTLIIGAVILGLVFQYFETTTYPILFSVFLPTLIHVSLFTGAFMLYGALKGRSITGVTAFIVFVICSILCFAIEYIDPNYVVSKSIQETYEGTSFNIVNYHFSELSHHVDPYTRYNLYESGFALMIQRFIAFSYTYHYLNWFSKTSIIKWNKVSKVRMRVIIVLWIASVALYLFDYVWGLTGLLLLSMLHVFLEFPLNYRSFIGIFQEFWNILKTGSFKPVKK
jgi:hypothetical protein